MAVENITLNIIPTGDTPSIHAAQYDVDRPFTITLKEGADDFTPTGYDIELQVRKVDSNIVTAIPTLTSGNVVTFNTTEQMTACSGTNLAELELTKDGQSFATLHFYLVVQRDVLAGGLTSQSEIYDLEEQIAAIVPEVIGDEYYTAEEVDEKIAEIPTFDPTNYYTKSQLYTKTETNGLLAQKANTSSLATVATSGSYNDLTNKPTIPDVSNYYTKSETYNQTEVNNLLSTKADTSSLATVATTGDYDDLINKPSLSTVATSGSYNDLTDKPTIPTNAEQLPIESGSATNTKDYIDTGLSGKADKTQLPNYITQPSGQTAQFRAIGIFFYYYADQWNAHIPFPFVTKNTSYTITLNEVIAENIGDITNKCSVIGKASSYFDIQTTKTMTALPNSFSVCVCRCLFTIQWS